MERLDTASRVRGYGQTGPVTVSGSMPGMAAMLAGLFPEIKGTLEAVFVALLVLLAAAVGAFALFVFAQQFRNPGRRDGPGR
jgi:hypothetical protein